MNATSIFSPTFDQKDSYGRLANELTSGFRARGWTVNQIGPFAPEDQTIYPVFGGYLLGYPTLYSKFGVLGAYGPRASITMFESTKIPDEWIKPLNSCAFVVVPSTWLVEVFQNCGVVVPIHVVPLGISKSYTHKFRSDSRKFRFLTLADGGKRKGWSAASLAFQMAFQDREDVELVIKSRKGRFPIRLSNPNITIMEEDLTDRQMNSFYHEFDCMAFPTLGEGFGLPPREFAATGGIPIVTNWGGTADDVDKWAFSIDCKMQDAWKGMRYTDKDNLGQWANPNVEQLAETMKMLVDMPIEQRNQIGLEFSKNVYELYDWDKFSSDCVRLFGEL